MNNNKRVIIAIALSALIMLAYMYYQSTIIQKSAIKQENNNTNNIANIEKTTTEEIKENSQKIEYTTVYTNTEKKVLENDYVIATFQNGDLISYKLKGYYKQDIVKKDKIVVDMVEQVYNNIHPFTLSFLNLSNSIETKEKLIYNRVSEDNNTITFYADTTVNNTPITIKKTFSFGATPYKIDNTVSIENKSDSPLSLYYSYFLGTGIGPYRSAENAVREDATKVQYLVKGNGKSKLLLTGDIVKPNIFSKLFGFGSAKTNSAKYRSYQGENKWVALNNRYFAIIATPPQNNIAFETMTFSLPTTNEYRNDYHIANFLNNRDIKARETITDSYSVYIGPKVRSIFSKDYREESYESIFQESFLGLNLRPLTYLLDIILNALYKITHSYAWAIILFTLLFKIVTYPLNHSSYKSMRKMQMVAPKIENLRKQYKDNPEKMNAEVMNIYRREKINPLGGCLPMLLPFPLLIAFFYLMQSMVELRNTSFLWITDLSSPDRLFIVPENIALIGGFNFNLIPIIMALTSFLSMKLQPSSSNNNTAAAAQMKMMSTIFPLMMLFMFYNFASGLALYWTAQNVFGIAQQFITSKILNKEEQQNPAEEVKKNNKKKRKR